MIVWTTPGGETRRYHTKNDCPILKQSHKQHKRTQENLTDHWTECSICKNGKQAPGNSEKTMTYKMLIRSDAEDLPL